jgi:hypothetical protein
MYDSLLFFFRVRKRKIMKKKGVIMNKQRIVGIVLLLVGIAALFFSGYIYAQVEEGRGKISNVQSKVDVGNKLLSIDPTLKKIGEPLTGSVQKQIDEGAATAERYETIAHFTQLGGIALLISGAVVLILSFNRKNQK